MLYKKLLHCNLNYFKYIIFIINERLKYKELNIILDTKLTFSLDNDCRMGVTESCHVEIIRFLNATISKDSIFWKLGLKTLDIKICLKR